MAIKILLFAQLAQQSGTDELELANEAVLGLSVLELYQQLQQSYQFSLAPQQLRAARNHVFCDWQQRLSADDCVAFIPPVGGG